MINKAAGEERFDKVVKQLIELSHEIAMAYFPVGPSRTGFYQEIRNLVAYVNHELNIKCMSQQGAEDILQEEINFLKKQHFQLMTGQMIQYAAVEKEKAANNYVSLVMKQVGFVGGGTQFFGGLGVCAASLGTACATFGLPLISHGVNNVYENGYYLLFRKSKSGPVREGYQKIASRLAYSQSDADLAYATIDLSLSGYGMTRMIVKPDTFRLFRHINTDYIRSWREMGKIPLGLEAVSDGITAYGIYQLRKDDK